MLHTPCSPEISLASICLPLLGADGGNSAEYIFFELVSPQVCPCCVPPASHAFLTAHGCSESPGKHCAALG